MGLMSALKIHLYFVYMLKEILYKFKVIFCLKHGIMVWNFTLVTSCWLAKHWNFRALEISVVIRAVQFCPMGLRQWDSPV